MTENRELLAKTLNCQMAVSLRGADIGVEPILSKGMYNKLWEHLDKVHAASDDLLEKAYQHGMPKSISTQKRTPALSSLFQAKPQSDFQFKKGQPIEIITISRLHWKKGFDYVLKALSILKSKGIPFRYTVLGDGEERERILYDIFR